MSFKVKKSTLPGVVVLEPKIFTDSRGFFYESFNENKIKEINGVYHEYVQDNHSKSYKGVLRGLHYQLDHPQGKLVRVVEGAIWDVAIDIRKGSPYFGKWFGITLSSSNKKQLWIPPNFAHGFIVISTIAQVLYKATDYYYPEKDRCIRWDDPSLNINWPNINKKPLLSIKDLEGSFLADADLPNYNS